MDNITLAKRAWSHLSKETYDISDDSGTVGVDGRSLKKLYDALADDVVLKFGWPEDTPVFGGEFRGKQAVIDLWTGQEPNLVSNHGLNTPPEFFANGDRVVMVYWEYYTIVKSGVSVDNCPCCLVMDFKDGLITRLVVIEDSAYWNDAYGWSSRS